MTGSMRHGDGFSGVSAWIVVQMVRVVRVVRLIAFRFRWALG
jgi:hypothetical protein